MQYAFKSKDDCEKCITYLNLNNIQHSIYRLDIYYLINIFDKSIKDNIEREEKKFTQSEKISLENGYLATKQYKEKTIIKIKNIEIGQKPIMIAGPCSIETESVFRKIAQEVKVAGADILRGGAFKPRTSPYDFQGLGKKGVEILSKVGNELDMPVITEIMDIRDLDVLIDKVDILQVGSRNMYNYSLLKELGKVKKPVLLKRGLSGTIKEFLLSAEYIMLGGNENVILCERGIRTYENYMRNTMDIGSISLIRELSHLPIMADPSHATGKKELIAPLSRGAVAAGADGLIIETHINPESAWSDGEQSIHVDQLRDIIKEIRKF